MTDFPRRVEGVDIAETYDGLLVSHRDSSLVTWLNRTAAMIYTMCTGTNGTQQISDTMRHLFDLSSDPQADVVRALGELQKAGLITQPERTDPGEISLLICAWTPGSGIARETLEQLDAIRSQLEDASIRYRMIYDPQPDRVLSHNLAASWLLTYEKFSHVLLLDASREATAAVAEVSLERILRSDLPLVGIPVAIPDLDWSRVAMAGMAGITDPAELSAAARHYNVAFTGVTQSGPRGTGFAAARFVGSSALVLARAGLQGFAGSSLVRRYRGLVGDDFAETLEHLWGFFDAHESTGGLQLTGDAAFCERWRANGGMVMIDTTGAFGTAVEASRKILRR